MSWVSCNVHKNSLCTNFVNRATVPVQYEAAVILHILLRTNAALDSLRTRWLKSETHLFAVVWASLLGSTFDLRQPRCGTPRVWCIDLERM